MTNRMLYVLAISWFLYAMMVTWFFFHPTYHWTPKEAAREHIYDFPAHR